MTGLADIEAAAARSHLIVLGGFAIDHAEPGLPESTRTLILVGPQHTGFWQNFTSTPEFRDGATDPLDRWSARVLGELAREFGGTALMPSDGPPYAPFYDWALRCGTFHAAPIGLLVHPRDGLMTSLRGAIALPTSVEVPPAQSSPCAACKGKPCLSSCPVGAFDPSGYAVDACHKHLDTAAGYDCMEWGCAARRACPVSQRSGRNPEQSAFHMRAFHGTR